MKRLALSTLFIAILMLVRCGGSPTAPAPQPLPQPNLVAVSTGLTIPADCENCSYGFELRNQGPGCGFRVQGTVELRNASGTLFASDAWGLPPAQRIVAGATVSVTDCCLRDVDVRAAVSVRVVVQAEAVSCQ